MSPTWGADRAPLSRMLPHDSLISWLSATPGFYKATHLDRGTRTTPKAPKATRLRALGRFCRPVDGKTDPDHALSPINEDRVRFLCL